MTVEGIADFRLLIADLKFILPTSAFLLYMPSPAFAVFQSFSFCLYVKITGTNKSQDNRLFIVSFAE